MIRGSGIRFMGNDVQEFEEGELAIIGSDLPHLLKNSPEYYDNKGLDTDVIALQFHKRFLGDGFFQPFRDGAYQ